MTMRGRRLPRHMLGLLALTAVTPAHAQEASVPRERTGPNATPAPVPEFAAPAEDPPLVPVPAPLQLSPDPALGGARIASVHLDANDSGGNAIPPAEWTPPDGGGELNLRHQPGQALDLEWVRGQFDSMLARGPLRASSALAAVQLINRAYLTAGFINSGLLVLPESDLTSGTLRLRLVYGELSAGASDPIAVEWRGGRAGLSDDFIRAHFPSARARPFNALDLERDFRLLAEDERVRTVSAALQAGEAPGQARLNLIIDPVQRFEFYSGAANDRSPSVGGERGFVGGLARNMLLSGDTLSAEVGFTEAAKDGQLSYSTPILSPATSLFVRAGFNNAAVIDRPLVPLDIKARERSAEIGLVQDIIRTPLTAGPVAGRWSSSQDLSVGVSIGHRRQKSYLLGEPFSFAPGAIDGRTEYTAMRLTTDYVRRNTDHVLWLSLTGTVGLGGTQSDIPSVPNPGDHFTSLRTQLSAAKRIGGGLELRGRLIGQYSNGTLYSGERLGIGGISSVRGYRESLYLADRGVSGSVEVVYPFSLSGNSGRGGVDWGAFSALAFVDGAWFGNVDAPRIQRDHISSVGVSLAWTPTDAFRASITYGHALQDVTTGGQKDLQDRGLHFQVSVRPFGLFAVGRQAR